ncbi:hypothetical protein H6G11_06160 [Cyanobacterium aponinum FACHB-4101]|uniref:hypothetical protein n=1 Tax=Cyanobacterium aponinum TaxID=379064 RepID=UPI00168149AB|nr:hypothetical protein [Cyanobacterium aponinum]MBD2393836.1 hypothetical protein [Cyanobacterium aponinum FACHB-4101]
MFKYNFPFFFLIIIIFEIIKIPVPFISFVKSAKAEKFKSNICDSSQLEANFELKESSIYICTNNEEKQLIQINTNTHEKILSLRAFGSFPTYGATEGNYDDPDSKIYNISPFDFKVIQASIITKIEPVISTQYLPKEVEITILQGSLEENAIASCQPRKPVAVFETEQDNIYICIEEKDNVNAIEMNYLQISKKSQEEINNIPAHLTNNFSYETETKNNKKYVVSYRGLKIYENQKSIEEIPIKNIYLSHPDYTEEDTH